MISNIPQEENLIITDNYYYFIKQLSEDYLKYIINYKIATNEYLKKYQQIMKNLILNYLK